MVSNIYSLPTLTIPQPLERGTTTITHVINHKTPMQFHGLAIKWGESVWDSWKDNHDWVTKTLQTI
ncbi:hypothetical protein COX05_03580 [candidate division WWE3 bacterium CG22_combo_CG10-13_8_21_14_all_39_12]|uniref:Uncharacterized protein n=2 Tax=Katanobacteria TaxID=422282 RepID=A0A2H0BFA1_UNCKA|nr:MAG: hypothetical protein COX05_03580 [candidate division WWE3 bacterium CG22_combo_CG10-13_8_21_14_all_39_12]